MSIRNAKIKQQRLLWKIVGFVVALANAPALAGILPHDAVRVTDTSGSSVRGIVCDNLLSTPPGEANYLTLDFPQYLDSRVTAKIAQLQDSPSNGEIRIVNGQIRYYPPLEFNEIQQPSEQAENAPRKQKDEITVGATREVNVEFEIHASDAAPGSAPLHTSRKTIVLTRPTVVLVHGINSGADSWQGPRGDGLTPKLRRLGYDVALLHHGVDDFYNSQRAHAGALFFKGNGPVEWQAARLKKLIDDSLARRRADGFACRRVDLVARSYGGLISRWYLRTNFGTPAQRQIEEQSRGWYKNSANVAGAGSLYWLSPLFFESNWRKLMEGELAPPINAAPTVRKFISVSSMWRGVPLCNYVNEIYAAEGPESVDAVRLGNAPVRWIGRLPVVNRHAGTLRSALNIQVANAPSTRVPALEVMAVNSLWMKLLNEEPFLPNIGYASIAGADNRYPWLKLKEAKLFGADSYTALDLAQRPSWFPYMKLERRPRQPGATNNFAFSDGVVPLWSALIPARADVRSFPSQQIVRADHANIASNPDSIRHIMRALNHQGIASGRELNTLWREPVVAQGRQRIWHFSRGDMAPDSHAGLYVLRDGIGRINPAAIGEIRDATHSIPQREGNHFSVGITWHTFSPHPGRVLLYNPWSDPGTGNLSFTAARGFHQSADAVQAVAPDAEAPWLQYRHQVHLSGLKPGVYYYRVMMDIPLDIPLVAGDRIVLSTQNNFGQRDFPHQFVVPNINVARK